jgi:hypothetical protein
MPKASRLKTAVPFVIAAAMAIASTPGQAVESSNAGEPAVFALIDALIASPPVDHATAERLTGAKLELDFSGALDDYSAQDVKRDDGSTIASILYREPVPGRGSQAGPLLLFEPGGACITLPTVMARYAGLSASGDEIAHGSGEQTYYSRSEEWGKLSFGFPGRSGRCLKSVSFTLRPQAHAPG